MASPTAITVTVDDTEYSRFEDDRDTVTVFIIATGTALTGEQIKVELFKARRNRDVAVAFKTHTLVNATTTEESIAFDLTEIVDQDEAPKVRRGKYFFRASSVSDTLIIGDSEDFLVSLVTVDNLRQNYLHGTDQRASDILIAHDQPVLVTGVEIMEVSRGHPSTWHPLAYNIVSDESGDFVRTISWCGGPTVALVSGTKRYTLRRGNKQPDWIRIRVPTIVTLPITSVSEDILIDRAPLDEARIREILNQAISWIEDSALDVFLEPTRIVTQPNSTAITFPVGSDILFFSLADWDEIVDAVSYRVPAAGHWINFKMPYRPLIRFDELFGQVSNTRIVDIALEWLEIHERGGLVELVPFNQELAFNFIGLIWVEALRGPVPLPNFWNFDALAGFRKTPKVLIELIAKKAAIDILTIAGQAFRGGFSSQSVSRDGVSESVSYTASAIYGIYSASIEQYKKWIDENLVKLRGAFRGSNMVVL